MAPYVELIMKSEQSDTKTVAITYIEARGDMCFLVFRPLPKIVSQNEFQLNEF